MSLLVVATSEGCGERERQGEGREAAILYTCELDERMGGSLTDEGDEVLVRGDTGGGGLELAEEETATGSGLELRLLHEWHIIYMYRCMLVCWRITCTCMGWRRRERRQWERGESRDDGC